MCEVSTILCIDREIRTHQNQHGQLPEASQVIIKIFNILGKEIRTLVDSPYQAGFHGVRWDGMDNGGNRVASGVYLYRLQAGEFSQVKKMSLLR